jgi:DNA-binding response OmpR family regulator
MVYKKYMAKILIVDDDREFLENLTTILEEEGHSYIATADSKTVEKKVRSYRPNLVILDVFLKDDNGKNIALDLKKTFDTKSIPILLISGSNKVKEFYKQTLAEAYLHKPFTIEQLTNIVSSLVIKKADAHSSLMV